MPKIIFFGKSDVGLKRTNNEDDFVISSELGFCLAADGMGGAAAGELASRFFSETATEVFSGSDSRTGKETLDLVQKVFSFANKRSEEDIGPRQGKRSSSRDGVYRRAGGFF